MNSKQELENDEQYEANLNLFYKCLEARFEDVAKQEDLSYTEISACGEFDRRVLYNVRNNIGGVKVSSLIRTIYGLGVNPVEFLGPLQLVWDILLEGRWEEEAKLLETLEDGSNLKKLVLEKIISAKH